jgi:hypothetical protein
MSANVEAAIRDYALTLANKIEETNEAICNTGGDPFEIGRKLGFGLSLYMLINSLDRAGVDLAQMGLGEIDPEAFIENPLQTAEVPRRERRPYRRSRRSITG